MLEVVIFILFVMLLILVISKSKQVDRLTSACKEKSYILDAINLPLFYKNRDGKLTGYNKAFDRNFKEFKKQTIDELEEFRTTCIKECQLTYDNNIKKSAIINFTKYSHRSVGVIFDISQIKNDKITLLKKKDMLDLALKGSRDGYWEWNVKSNALMLSKRAKEILGYKDNEKAPENITSWMNLVESCDIAKTNEALSLHVRGESEFIDIEHRLKTSLKEQWVNFRGKGIYGANNDIIKVYGTIRDVTSEKLKLTKAIKQRDLFMTFMDNLPALSFMKDREGRYIYINSFFQRLLGFKAWKNKKVEEIFDEATSRYIVQSDRESFYEGKYRHEEYMPNEEGVMSLYETYKFPVDSGEKKILCGFGLDITQDRVYQEKIELYSKIFDNTNEAIILTDEKGITIDINKAFTDLTGYSNKDILGRNPSIRQSGKHTKIFYTKMWESLLAKDSWRGEIFNKHKNGTIYPELMSINTIKNEKREITNFVGIFQSIERQKII